MIVEDVSLNKIKLSKNSRMSIQDEDLSELMHSIKENGLLQPIGVVEVGGGKYDIAYGNRRFLAVSKLGLTKIAAVIHPAQDQVDIDIKNLSENIQRRNISLTEVGRYLTELMDAGMNRREVAIRLGVTKTYIETVMRAYKSVPDAFKKDLEVRTVGQQKTYGKIPVRVATSILSAQRVYGLNKEQTDVLFTAAKKSESFLPENINRYATALAAGEQDILKNVEPYHQVVVRFLVTESEFQRLNTEHVEQGPYNSVSGLLKDIVAGKKAVKVNLSQEARLKEKN